MKEQEFSWLIELHAQCYIQARTSSYMRNQFAWTTKHDEALRFVSEKQCQDTLDVIRALQPELFPTTIPDYARPVEHGWINLPARQPKEETK